VRATLQVAAALLCAVTLAACGRDRSGGDDPAAARTQTVERTTRVEVVKQAGRQGGFDPEGIYRRDAAGVVTILSTGGDGGGGGQGSGFVVDGRGEIATNAHVVTTGEGNDIRRAESVYVRFRDGNQVPASIVGFDPFADVALLRLDPRGLRLRPLPLGSTDDLVVGAPVAAIGSPFGEEQSLSVGVISALDRSIESLTGFSTTGAIQTDAAINRGNSGGPLLDARGRVLGINAQIRTATGAGSGVGFAVPVDSVRRSLSQLRRHGRVRYGYLGVTTAPVYPQLAERFDLGVDSGAWVQDVAPDGPADDAGLRAGDDRVTFQHRPYVEGGDVVTAVNGRRVRHEADLAAALLGYGPGRRVRVDVIRDGRRTSVQVVLGERPLDAPR
jgi:S1-C subfamily serine protease